MRNLTPEEWRFRDIGGSDDTTDDHRVDGYRAGILEEAEAIAMKREAEAKLDALAPKPEVDRTLTAGEMLTDLSEAWPAMEQEERRDMVQAILEAVSVGVASGSIDAFAPRSDFAPLFEVVAKSDTAPITSRVCTWRPRADSNRRSPP